MNVMCKRTECYFNSAVQEEGVGFCVRTRVVIGESGCLSFDNSGKDYTVKKREAMGLWIPYPKFEEEVKKALKKSR